jgi:hypothetical protein
VVTSWLVKLTVVARIREDPETRIGCVDDDPSTTKAKKHHSERKIVMAVRMSPRGSGPQITRPSQKNT